MEELNEYLLSMGSFISGTKANGKSKFNLCIGWMEHWDKWSIGKWSIETEHSCEIVIFWHLITIKLNNLIYSRYQFLFSIQSKHTDFKKSVCNKGIQVSLACHCTRQLPPHLAWHCPCQKKYFSPLCFPYSYVCQSSLVEVIEWLGLEGTLQV